MRSYWFRRRPVGARSSRFSCFKSHTVFIIICGNTVVSHNTVVYIRRQQYVICISINLYSTSCHCDRSFFSTDDDGRASHQSIIKPVVKPMKTQYERNSITILNDCNRWWLIWIGKRKKKKKLKNECGEFFHRVGGHWSVVGHNNNRRMGIAWNKVGLDRFSRFATVCRAPRQYNIIIILLLRIIVLCYRRLYD